MNKLIVDRLAVQAVRKCIKDAMRIHEESYVHDTIEVAGVSLANGRYGMAMEDAVIQACRENSVHHLLAPLVWLALAENGHNDVQAWADGDYDASFDADGKPVEQKPFEFEVKFSTEAV